MLGQNCSVAICAVLYHLICGIVVGTNGTTAEVLLVLINDGGMSAGETMAEVLVMLYALFLASKGQSGESKSRGAATTSSKNESLFQDHRARGPQM